MGDSRTAVVFHRVSRTVHGAVLLTSVLVGCSSAKTAAGRDGSVTECGECPSGMCFEGVCDGANVVEIGAGENTVCALLRSGSVWCWGDGAVGQLGVAPSTLTSCGPPLEWACRPKPAAVPGIRDATHLAVGRGMACVVRKDRTVGCFGLNDRGQLGHAPGTGGDLPPAQCLLDRPCNPKPVTVPKLTRVSGVEVGLSHACALVSNGTVNEAHCWGANDVGQLGLGTIDGDVHTPAKVLLPGTPSTLATGGSPAHSCAVLQGRGQVYCWGSAYGGQLGRPPDASEIACTGPAGVCRPSPSPVLRSDGTPLSGALDVVVGDGFTCALLTDAVHCFGVNLYGTFGDGSAIGTMRWAGSAIPDLRFQAISAARTHVCGKLVDDRVACWGTNSSGELGNGLSGMHENSVACGNDFCVGTPQIGEAVYRIAAGLFHTAVVTQDGAVRTWGANLNGQMGHAPGSSGNVTCTNQQGTGSCQPTPTDVLGLP